MKAKHRTQKITIRKMTVRQAIDKIAPACDRQQAKWAVKHLLKLNDIDLLSGLDNDISDSQEEAVISAYDKIKQGEPLQYVLGRWQFIDLELKVDKRALIPRPETELLAIEAVREAEKITAPKVIDIGCGTGCIGLYIKSKVQSSNVTLLDISQDALDLAEENAKELGLVCELKKADMREVEQNQYDIIVSNPPYIKTEDIAWLDSNVRDYEPIGALDGGVDGLTFYRALYRFAEISLAENGVILMEIGINQADDVTGIFKKTFSNIEVINDINGIERIVKIKR